MLLQNLVFINLTPIGIVLSCLIINIFFPLCKAWDLFYINDTVHTVSLSLYELVLLQDSDYMPRWRVCSGITCHVIALIIGQSLGLRH
jgi:hypothetical protein